MKISFWSVFRWTQRSITQRHAITLGPIFKKMVLNRAQGLKKKVMKFQREKITTGSDIPKNVEGGRIPPPALLGLKRTQKIVILECL